MPGSTAAATCRWTRWLPAWPAASRTCSAATASSPTEERAIARLALQKVEIVTNEAVTLAEATWLAQRIGRDGRLTPNERALLMFLKAESPSIHPSLQALVDKAAAAA